MQVLKKPLILFMNKCLFYGFKKLLMPKFLPRHKARNKKFMWQQLMQFRISCIVQQTRYWNVWIQCVVVYLLTSCGSVERAGNLQVQFHLRPLPHVSMSCERHKILNCLPMSGDCNMTAKVCWMVDLPRKRAIKYIAVLYPVFSVCSTCYRCI